MNDPMRLEYRPLSAEASLAVLKIKGSGAAFYADLEKHVLPGREASLAKTKVEEAVMWAVKSITS